LPLADLYHPLSLQKHIQSAISFRVRRIILVIEQESCNHDGQYHQKHQ
jgi:hypothetical protein